MWAAIIQGTPIWGAYVTILILTAFSTWKFSKYKNRLDAIIKSPHKCAHNNILDRVAKLEETVQHMQKQIERQDVQFTAINTQLEDIKATTNQTVSLIQNLQKQLMDVALHKKN